MKTLVKISILFVSFHVEAQIDTLYYGSKEFDQLHCPSMSDSVYGDFPANCNTVFDFANQRPFTGVLGVCYKQRYSLEVKRHGLENKKAFNSICPVQKFYFYENGSYKYCNEIGYYADSKGVSNGVINYKKIHIDDKLSAFYTLHYDLEGRLKDSSLVYFVSDTMYQNSVRFKPNGDTLCKGIQRDGVEEGLWRTWAFNDSIALNEFWHNGILTDILNTDIIYVGKNNKIIQKDEYFEMIGSQDNIQWSVYSLSPEQIISSGKSFIMYSELLDFIKEYDTKGELFIEEILKKSKKVYNKK